MATLSNAPHPLDGLVSLANASLTAKVVSPKRSNLVLATDVPHVEFDILVGNRLDVESDGRNGRHVLAELELVQDGRLSSGIETQHEKSHLL